MMRLKNSGLPFLSDFIEHFWKFFIFAIDRVIELNEITIEKKYEKDLVSLSQKAKSAQEQMIVNTVKFKKIEIDLKDKLKEAKENSRKYEEGFKFARDLYQELLYTIDMEKQKHEKEKLYQNFKDMEKNLKELNKKVEVAYLENVNQTRMVRDQLLSCFMIAMGKNFKSRSRSIGCQTELGMCEFADISTIYGIQEHLFKEKDVLQLYKHPFLSYLVKQLKNNKIRIPDTIQTVEEYLDLSLSGVKKGDNISEIFLGNMKREMNNYHDFCIKLSEICKNLTVLASKGNNYARSICKLLGIGGYSMIPYSAIDDFAKFRKMVKDTIPGKIISFDVLREHDITFDSISQIFREKKSLFYQKSDAFKKKLLGISRFKFTQEGDQIKIDKSKVSNNPFLVTLINRVHGEKTQDFKSYLYNLFSNAKKISEKTSKKIKVI